jgi:23S rRNA (guanosine2251-2'-O)-methyltransferase
MKRVDKIKHNKGSGDYSWCVGKRAVEELVTHRLYRIIEILCTSDRVFTPPVAEKIIHSGASLSIVTKNEFTALHPEFESLNHQWVAAKITPGISLRYQQIFEKVLKDTYPLVLALDQVQDPQNLGAIFRVCECAGVSALLLTSKRSAHVSPLVRKVSAGATEFVPFSEVSNLASVIEYAKKKGFWVYGSSLSASSSELYSAKVHEPVMLVMGSEHSGLRRQTEALCDQLIQIPQYGLLQSMNVASSAAVMLFELQRRLRYESPQGQK